VRCATPLNRRADTTRLPTTLTTVCLLVFAWQTESEYPLVVAANRDERLDRPARSLVVLRPSRPRVLGGLDEIAGGTWLAVNERGVVAGLTNRPAPGGRDLTKRSRGELPLMVAEQRCADEGVSQLLATVRGGDYNPAWLLIGDRQVLYYVELAADQPPTVHQLAPGVHVLENVALGDASVKADRIRSLVSSARSGQGDLWAALPGVLADHTLPEATAGSPAEAEAPVGADSAPGGAVDAAPGRAVDTSPGGAVGTAPRREATLAACVHTDDYGTRSAALVRVPEDPTERPEMQVADGPPCTSPFVDVGSSWTD
jgi:uncharacterized protein with NRDE domain